jgi:uncharacterized tellurite resistance protein B-like protein
MSQRITLDGLSLRERSEYFRGLLLVMAADGELHDAERELIKHAISPFDFSAEFVEESIESILKNKHVSQVPPRFESQANACLFLRAALDIAFADGVLDETEEKWLRATADLNGIAAEWLEEQIAERE